jgi:hypothetical protein
MVCIDRPNKAVLPTKRKWALFRRRTVLNKGVTSGVKDVGAP